MLVTELRGFRAAGVFPGRNMWSVSSELVQIQQPASYSNPQAEIVRNGVGLQRHLPILLATNLKVHHCEFPKCLLRRPHHAAL